MASSSGEKGEVEVEKLDESDEVLKVKAQRMDDALKELRFSDGGKKYGLKLRAIRHELDRRRVKRLAEDKLRDKPVHVLMEMAQRMQTSPSTLRLAVLADKGEKYILLSRAVLHEIARRQAAPAADSRRKALLPHPRLPPRHQPGQAAREDADSPQPGGQSARSASRSVRHEVDLRQVESLAANMINEPVHDLQEKARVMQIDLPKARRWADKGVKHELMLRAILYELTRRKAAPAADPPQESPELGCQSARSASPQPPPRRQVQPSYTKEEYLKVYNDASSSVVTVFIKLNIGKPKELRVVHIREVTGFIVRLDKYHSDFRTIVAVHSGCFADSMTRSEVVEVQFSDGTICRCVLLFPEVENFEFRLVEVLEDTSHEHRKCVEFSVEGVTMNEQEVFSIISLKRQLCMFKSPIIQANCAAVALQDSTCFVEGSQYLFAFRCPVSAVLTLVTDDDLKKREIVFRRIMGAPIFNMIGKVVGTVHSCGSSYDLKFGIQGKCVNDSLSRLLIQSHWLRKGQSLVEKEVRERKRRKT